MTALRTVTLEVSDVATAREFYESLGVATWIRLRPSDAPTAGFRGCHLSLVLPQPTDVDALVEHARAAGAEVIKPPKKSIWGYGGVFRAPDGTLWKAVSESKRNSGSATGEITDIVLLLGCEDVRASKQFYLDHGFAVAKSFGGKYVEFDAGSNPITLGLLRRQSLAKDAGVSADGSGSHRIILGADAASFTDPDGFVWASDS